MSTHDLDLTPAEIDSLDDLRAEGELRTFEHEPGEYMVFASREDAGIAARAYWDDMRAYDPEEFTCLVGAATMVAWAHGRPAGPGSTKVLSLESWLDLWLDTPEEHYATYDGAEIDLGHGVVAYRCN